MAESSWPTTASGRSIDDVQWERMSAALSPDGIIGSAADLPVVYADSTGMQIKVRAAKTGFLRGHGWYSGTSEFTRPVVANASGSTRIDLAVLRLTRATREVSLVVKAGTPGSGAPALTQDPIGSGSNIWEMGVGQITVPSAASTISAGQVINIARYLYPKPAMAAPMLFSMLSPTINGGWSFTAPPTSDAFNAPGMFYDARQTIVKQSPDSRLKVDLRGTGYHSGQGMVYFGVRVMAPGYTSTNHLVTHQFFNYPRTLTTSSADGHTHSVAAYHMHMPFNGLLYLPNLPLNAYTVQVWIYTGGGLNFKMDANDYLHFELSEV